MNFRRNTKNMSTKSWLLSKSIKRKDIYYTWKVAQILKIFRKNVIVYKK
jgi:hypothetical protein